MGEIKKNSMSRLSKLFLGFIFFMTLVYVWLTINQESCLQIFAPIANRELGVIELLQSFILVIVVFIGISQTRINFSLKNFHTISWIIFSALMSFILLEETDYGLHYYDYLLGNNSYDTSLGNGFRNIHNQGVNNIIIKTIIFVIQILFFGILPFLNTSIGKINFRKNYGFFFWTITLVTPLLFSIIKVNYSSVEVENLLKSQLFTEMKELASYFMFLVFLIQFRNVLFTSWNFELKKLK